MPDDEERPERLENSDPGCDGVTRRTEGGGAAAGRTGTGAPQRWLLGHSQLHTGAGEGQQVRRDGDNI